MYFDLTDEQKMLQANLRSLLEDGVDLNALARATPEDVAATESGLDTQIAAMGVCAALAPAAHGGLELGLLTLVAVSEELGRCTAPSACIRSALAAWLIASVENNAIRTNWLGPLLEGKATAAFAPGAGGAWSDGLPLEGAKVSGERAYVEGAQDADFFVLALSDGRLAVAPRTAAVTVTTPPPLDVSRSVSTVCFDGATVSPLDVTPDIAERLRQAHLILLSADAYGAGQRAHDMTVAYVQERRQFGQPIGAFQAIKHQLADTALLLAPSRFLPWRAALAWDTADKETPRLAALAKAHTPDVAVATARAMVEAHGGVGYTWEYPLHLLLKRSMYDRVAWGGPALHRAAAARSAVW